MRTRTRMTAAEKVIAANSERQMWLTPRGLAIRTDNGTGMSDGGEYHTYVGIIDQQYHTYYDDQVREIVRKKGRVE